jgi:GPH family glycoside/pentoside/hexuronide:cation symporter
LVSGLAPLLVKERVKPTARQTSGPQRSLKENLKLTFTSRPFLTLIAFSLFLMMATYVKGNLEFFARLNYVFQGDQKLAATVSGVGGTLSAIIGILGIPIFQWVANRHGKIFGVKLIMGIGFFASLSTWFLYTPEMPYLSLVPGLLLAPCMTAVWVLIPSMTGDVADHDELRSGERREGAFAASYSWTLKLSISLATLLSGPLVNLCGYDSSLKGALQPEKVITNMRIAVAIVPAVVSAAGIWMIHKYPLTTEKIAEVKAELDARHAQDK